MTDDRRDSYNPPVDTSQSPGEGGHDLTNEPGNNAAPSLDTALDTSHTRDVGVDPAGSGPGEELGEP